MIRLFVARLSERYQVRGVAVYDSYENGAVRRDGALGLAVVLRTEIPDPGAVALDMSWDALTLYFETGVRITPIPLFYDHWREPALAPDPELVTRVKMKSVWVWL